jgi:hypothetical protein
VTNYYVAKIFKLQTDSWPFFSSSLKKKHSTVNRCSQTGLHSYQGPSGSLIENPKNLSLTIHFNVRKFLESYTWYYVLKQIWRRLISRTMLVDIGANKFCLSTLTY